MRKFVLLSTVVLLQVLAFTADAQQPLPAVWVDMSEVTGVLPGTNVIVDGSLVSIPIRFTNVDQARTAISNGFYFHGSGVSIDSISVKWNGAYPWGVEEALLLGCYPWEECYAWFDYTTVESYIDKGLGGYGMVALTGSGDGMPADFDDIAYTLHLSDVGGYWETLTLDTTWWPPANLWLWTGVEEDVSWGGPYEWLVNYNPCQGGPFTYCWPQPVELGVNDNDRVLKVYIECELNIGIVDLSSVKVFGQIPTYTQDQAWIEDDDLIVTDCFLMRFLGSGGFRPLPPDDFIGEYFVTYNYYIGTERTLYGDFAMNISQGDVNFDGSLGIDDVVFMTDHLFGDGPGCTLDGCKVDELMDVDQSGRFDMLDVGALIEMIM
ncbi:MAG: hypothetical protein JSV52_14120 [Candidatus Zixiibacteriota bacterium]|nr:MAG: hypothetical protein JSV52_14120 [candidate division Zixibacteria bacterium]